MALNGTSGTTLAPASSAGGVPGSAKTDPLLDKNAFLKLMMVQLQDQDPLNPQDPSQYLGQLAQMTSVEQLTNAAESAATTATQQTEGTALGLLGHTVSYTDGNGDTQSGTVTKVSFTTSGPSLTVGGVSGVLSTSVTQVS
jgi:flagellar basal-body rod modification protein FlgD